MRGRLLVQTRPINLLAAAERVSRTGKAVEHCQAEWSRAYELAKEKGLSAQKALRMASVAYKLAMPKMDTITSIRAAIACIANGVALEVFDGRDGSQLLYAAQVALTVYHQTRKGKK
jgi:hypothetical protein